MVLNVKASMVTQIDMKFNGLDLTRWGGPVGSLDLKIIVPDDAVDLTPNSITNGSFAASYTIGFGNETEITSGWIQFRNRSNKDSIIFTVPFPSKKIPDTTLNIDLFGLDLVLFDSSLMMLSSKTPSNLNTDFTNHVTSFLYFFRIGGSSADTGTWKEYTNDSLSTASFNSTVTRIHTPVPIPSSIILLFSSISMLSLFRKGKHTYQNGI